MTTTIFLFFSSFFYRRGQLARAGLAEFSEEEKEIYQQPYCECLALFSKNEADIPLRMDSNY